MKYTRKTNGGFRSLIPKIASQTAPEVNNQLTSMLSVLAKDKMPFDYIKATQKIRNPIPSNIYIPWELQLQQCAFLSRLAYCPSAILLEGVKQGMECHADDMNNLITELESKYYLDENDNNNFGNLFIKTIDNSAPTPTQNAMCGEFFPKSGCTLLQYYNESSKINSEPTLYVCFKGSSSMKDFGNDLNASPFFLSLIPGLSYKDKEGNTISKKGQCHYGFYNHMRDELVEILQKIGGYIGTLGSIKKGSTGRIVVTGHSLGGAMATICAFILANLKEQGQIAKDLPLHCITFGAPKVFDDIGRNEFNAFLNDGSLTLDRIWVTGDVIPNIPPTLSHPGYKVLRLRNDGQLTGRMPDIGKIRAIFCADPLPLSYNNAILHWDYTNPYTLPRGSIAVDPAQVAAAAAADKGGIDGLPTGPSTNNSNNSNSNGPQKGGGAFNAFKQGLAGAKQGIAEVKARKEASMLYKQNTLNKYPNGIQYVCTSFGCHGGYMNIGFMNALRVPLVFRKKNYFRPMRVIRKEPTIRTTFLVENGHWYGPGKNIYIQIVSQMQAAPAPTVPQPVSPATPATPEQPVIVTNATGGPPQLGYPEGQQGGKRRSKTKSYRVINKKMKTRKNK
jgi:hypothetical protein